MPFNAPIDRPCKLWLSKDLTDRTEFELEQCSQYTIQGDLFSKAILDDTPVPTPIEDAVANMVTIEAIVESGKSNQWVSISSLVS